MEINVEAPLFHVLPAEDIRQSKDIVITGEELVERAHNQRIAV